MDNQKFCLTWKDYNSNFSKEFGEFRKHEDFFDVTLACEENTITAHKIVLSAASDFFKNILRKHKHEHPLIYLTEVKISDLQSILDFIYTGETEVAERDLESLLATATRFKVKGLTDGAGGSEVLSSVPAGLTTALPVGAEAVKRKLKTTDLIIEDKRPKILTPALKTTITPVYTTATAGTVNVTETGALAIVKSEHVAAAGDSDPSLPVRAVRTSAEPIDISSFLSPEEQQQFESEAVAVAGSFPKTVSNVIDTSGISVSQDYLNNKTELDRQCNELMVSSYDSSVGKTVWQCAQCHYSSKLRYTVKEHVETHISGFSHQCPLCDKTCNTRNALRVHTIRKHSNKVQVAKQVQQNMLSLPPPS